MTAAPVVKRWWYVTLAFLGILVVWFRLGRERTPWSQDETDLTSAAVAMACDPHWLLRPSYHPFASPAHTTLGGGLVAPPLASALMAIPSWLGWHSPSMWPLVSLAVFLSGITACTRALVCVRWWQGAAATVVMIGLSPRLVIDALTLEAEVALTGFALWALALAWNPHDVRRWKPAWSGALLGLAFLCKLWLALPFALALILLWARSWRLLGVFLLTATVTSASHLVVVAVLDAASLGRWLREVYFAILGLDGIAASKWAGVTAHPEWSHGPWYYPPAIVRELGVAVLFASFGAWRLVRRSRRAWWPLSSRGRAALGLAGGLLLVSIPRIKEPLYVLPFIGLGVSLAAYGFLVGERLARPAALRALVLLTFAAVCACTPRPPGAPDDGRVPHVRATTECSHATW